MVTILLIFLILYCGKCCNEAKEFTEAYSHIKNENRRRKEEIGSDSDENNVENDRNKSKQLNINNQNLICNNSITKKKKKN